MRRQLIDSLSTVAFLGFLFLLLTLHATLGFTCTEVPSIGTTIGDSCHSFDLRRKPRTRIRDLHLTLRESKNDAALPQSKPKRQPQIVTTKNTHGVKTNKHHHHRNNQNNQIHRQINQEIIQAETASELLDVLQKHAKLSSVAAGRKLNSVNFSTAIHRLARKAVESTNFDSARATIFADPRTALFMTSLAEAMVDPAASFRPRELSNIGWAIAKLKMPPPSQITPIVSNEYSVCREQVVQSAKLVREHVIAAALQPLERNNRSWIPQLSILSGRILDLIGARIVKEEEENQTNYNASDGQTFQMQERANLLWAWASAGRADEKVFGVIIQSMIRQQEARLNLSKNDPEQRDLQPQEWSNALWAFGTAKIFQSHDQLLEYVANLLQKYPDFIDRFKSQELANTAWAVATLVKEFATESPIVDRQSDAALTILRHVATSSTKRNGRSFRTQEIANVAWALATLGFGLTMTSEQLMNNYVVLQSDQPLEDAKLKNQAVDFVVKAALPLLSKYRCQELNNLAWSMARLLSPEDLVKDPNYQALLHGIGTQLSDSRRKVTSQDVGTTLWSFATLAFVDDTIYRSLAARISPMHAHTYKPQELSNIVWGLKEIEINEKDAFDTTLVPESQRPTRLTDPITVCFAVAAQELVRRPHQFKSQEMKDVLYSFSKAGIRHPGLFKSVAEHLAGGDDSKLTQARGLDEFSPQGLGNLAWSYARQAQLGDEVSERLSLRSMGNGRLTVYRTSYFDVGESLLHRLFALIAEAKVRVHDELRKGKPQDISNTAWSFSVLGMKPSVFLEKSIEAFIDRSNRFVNGERSPMTSFKGQEIANLVYAVASLNYPPGKLLEALEQYLKELCKGPNGNITLRGIARNFKRLELAMLGHSCACFYQFPEELMSIIYQGLVGSGHEQDPNYMMQQHQDDGLQKQAIMTLIYLQAAVDLEGCCQDLKLPKNFPDGWQQSKPTTTKRDDCLTDLPLELNLSTSKIQRSVSKAFSRIGFDHVEEHTITLKEMAIDFGIRVNPSPMEILSIDLANIESRIAIEVDGPAHYISRIDDRASHSIDGVEGHSKIVKGQLEYQFAWTGEFQEINGPTALKHRLLTALGWNVIHVPFWDWYALEGNTNDEDNYCRRLLAGLE